MFEASVYANRRQVLLERMAAMTKEGERGIAVFLGNVDAAMNYRGNDYKFRQDSNFMYYWGIDEPCFAAILDLDNAQECLYGNDVDIDDIIWMGPQPSVASKGEQIGCAATKPLAEFDKAVVEAVAKGRQVHFLPPARYYNQMKLAELTGTPSASVRKVAPMAADAGKHASEELVKAVVSMRLIKEQCEIEEIDKACEIGYWMHTEARRGCKPGALEQDIVGRMEGVTYSKGWGPSFTTILSQNGETLHNHSHHHPGADDDNRASERDRFCSRICRLHIHALQGRFIRMADLYCRHGNPAVHPYTDCISFRSDTCSCRCYIAMCLPLFRKTQVMAFRLRSADRADGIRSDDS